MAAVTTGFVGTAASLTKNIMGIGVLTLAAGMAAGTGVGPATLAMLATTMTAAYSFALLGDACELTGLGTACTFEGLWAATLGSRTEWLVNAAIGSLTFSICTVYLICLGELLPPLLSALRAPHALRARRPAIALAAAAIFPLCLPLSLARLSWASMLGVCAIAFTAVFSFIRWRDGSYAPGGVFYDGTDPALRPRFESHFWQLSEQSPVLLANLGVALNVHFNAPSFYRALTGATARRFRVLAYTVFGLVFLLSLLISHPGYFTFGEASQPLILTNYHPTADGLATAARAATALSLGCSFPIVFAALREVFLGGAPAGRTARWWLITLALATSVLTLSATVNDLGTVVSPFLFPPSPHPMCPSPAFVAELDGIAVQTDLRASPKPLPCCHPASFLLLVHTAGGAAWINPWWGDHVCGAGRDAHAAAPSLLDTALVSSQAGTRRRRCAHRLRRHWPDGCRHTGYVSRDSQAAGN